MHYNDYFKIGNSKELNSDELFYINEIKKQIIDYYESLNITFDYEEKIIQKGQFGYPIFCNKMVNQHLSADVIFLSIESYAYWCQVIYQLSHEITHCFIYCHNKQEKQKASWIEETICEAMSLYFLKEISLKWSRNNLSKIASKYNESIQKYLNDLLQRQGTSKLTYCKNIDELMIIDEKSQENRNDRLNEMKMMYNVIDEKSIEGLIKYRDYIKGNKILDTDKYRNSYPDNRPINYLCDLQDKIIRNNS